MNAKRFNAPWGKWLWIMSVLATTICIFVSATLFRHFYWVWGILPLLGIGVAALFAIRGYLITADAILVERPFWNTRIPLAGLQSARVDPDAVRGSIRTCGNGGFFSFTGWYWNRRLRAYRAFATDLKRVVALKFSDRTIVLTPESPEEFVSALTPYITGRGACASR